MSDYLLIEQMADAKLHASPLSHVEESTPASVSSIVVTLVEKLAHLVIRGEPAILATPVHDVLAISLPTQPLQAESRDDLCIRWISPDEWLLTLPEQDALTTETRLREACPTFCALVNVSGGQTLFTVSGPSVEQVLMKSIPYDIHPSVFPVGKTVTVPFAQAQCVLRRVSTNRFELIVRRSFADYVWRWLADASREFGMVIQRV